jgi:O-antigen ligase
MNKIYNFDNQRVFFMLFPLIYISGPLFTEIFLIILFFKNFNNLNLIKKEILKDYRVVQIFFILIFFQGFLNFPELNFKNFLYMRFYFYYLSIKILLYNDEKINANFNLFIRTTIYVFSILILFHTFQLFTNYFTLDERITIPIRQEEIAISIYSKFYPIILILLLFPTKNFNSSQFFSRYKYLLWLIAYIIPLIAIFSGERMNTIMLILSIFLLVIRSKPLFFLYFLSFFVIIFLFLKNFENLNSLSRIDYVIERYNIFFLILKDDFLINSVWGNHYLSSINIFKDNFLLGIGIKMFSSECLNYVSQFEYACTSHPHNIYLELASEGGVLILILAIIIFFKVFKIFIINLFKDKFNLNDIMIFAFSICILIYSFPLRSTGSFFNNYNSSFFWVFLALLFYFYEKQKKDK